MTIFNEFLKVDLVVHLTSAQEGCIGFIGSSDAERAATPSRAQMLYLNTANPAPCTGNITSWTVCYYGPDVVNPVGIYYATYALYRRTGSGNSACYVRVSEMFRAVRSARVYVENDISEDVDGEIKRGSFNCYTDTLDVGASPLMVETGDILGACVFDPDYDFDIPGVSDILVTLPFDVVGEASGESLLQMSTAGCSRSDLPSDILADQLLFLNSRRLHIYANVGKLHLI